MEKITPKTCKKYGRKKLIDGFQYENIWYRCKDRRNCEICKKSYVYGSGRYNSVKNALENGAKVYTIQDSDWDSVKKQADRDGLAGDYIRIKSEQDVVYFIASTPCHERATEINPKGIDWEYLISHSTGRSQFKGEYTIKKKSDDIEQNAINQEMVELKSYFPVFKYSDTGAYVPETLVDESALPYLYLNPKWDQLNSNNAQDFLKWRACFIAEAISCLRSSWQVVHMTEEIKEIPKSQLDDGNYVTNYRIKFIGMSGKEIKNEAHKRAIELQLGITEPKIPFDRYKIEAFSPEYNDGTVEERTPDNNRPTFADIGIDLDSLGIV